MLNSDGEEVSQKFFDMMAEEHEALCQRLEECIVKIRQQNAAIKKLRDALVGLVGIEYREELGAAAHVIPLMRVPEKTMILDAVKALLETEE